MKKSIIIFLLTIAFVRLNAQCTSGNCVSGYGTYNYGWCVYTGEFKNSKPEGKGAMKYDDYTYTGQFANGLEDGEGIITNKNGSREKVTYVEGKKATSLLARIPENEYKPLDVQDVNCSDGNCNTGYGTYQFPSGNKYAGNFSNHRFEGQGAFIFANGDKFEGVFHNNEKVNGIYKYFTGAVYAGTYDGKGMEYNGTITSPQGFKIPYVNGKPIIPPAPKPVIPMGANLRGDQGRKAAPAQVVKMTCSVCFGSGVQKRVEDWSNPTTTHLVSVSSPCWKCHGTGVE